MGIWIRSQDKRRLIECTRFGIDYYSDGICDVIGADCDDVFELGKYKGEEKAVLVLDMIQKHIETRINNVFQMPRDIIVIDDEEEEV
ncbi:MAG: hypothetical protein ACLTE9_14305 [Thomasclavelia ramosa]